MSTKIIDYTCVAVTKEMLEEGKLIEGVKQHLDSGWQPLGAPVVIDGYVTQYMVKYN